MQFVKLPGHYDRDNAVARIIARPFIGKPENLLELITEKITH